MSGDGAHVLRADGLGVEVALPGREPLVLGRGLDLVVRPGRSTAVVGRSGCGKTTLLATLGLLRRPSAGRLWVAGRDTTDICDAAAARWRNAHIGFVFQDYSLVAHLTVLDNVMLPLDYGTAVRRRTARQTAGAQLDAVGLAGFERRRPAQLSGGEQQRVAVARALVRGPVLVLADEPTGALDVETGDEVMGHLLAAVAHAGAAAVVVTHDHALAARTDEVLELAAGVLQAWEPR